MEENIDSKEQESINAFKEYCEEIERNFNKEMEKILEKDDLYKPTFSCTTKQFKLWCEEIILGCVALWCFCFILSCGMIQIFLVASLIDAIFPVSLQPNMISSNEQLEAFFWLGLFFLFGAGLGLGCGKQLVDGYKRNGIFC